MLAASLGESATAGEDGSDDADEVVEQESPECDILLVA